MRALIIAPLLLFTSASALVTGRSRDIKFPYLDSTVLSTDLTKATINLDLRPEDRWNHIVKAHREAILYYYASGGCDVGIETYGRDRVRSWVQSTQATATEDQMREIQGIVDAVNDTRFTWECAVMMNVYYEAQGFQLGDPEKTNVGNDKQYRPHACTGVLAATPNGTVIHGRNLDWGHYRGQASILWFDLTFIKGGMPLFQSVTMFPIIGVLSGMTYGSKSWSFEQNSRGGGPHPLEVAEKGGHAHFLTSRHLMDQGKSYIEALQALSSTQFSAMGYFVLAGSAPWEGAIMTIDNRPEVTFPNIEVLDPETRPFMYQLNNDRWLNSNDERHSVVTQFFAQKPEISAESIWNLMRTPGPVLNDANLHTFVAVPATHYFIVHANPEGSATVNRVVDEIKHYVKGRLIKLFFHSVAEKLEDAKARRDA